MTRMNERLRGEYVPWRGRANDSVARTFRGEDERDKNKRYGAGRTNDEDENDKR
jgi:hypothetical protein